MSIHQATALCSLVCTLLFGSAAAAQEAVKPIPAEPTAEERAATREEARPGEPITAADWARQERKKQGQPIGEAPLDPAPQEAAPAQSDKGPITAAEWAKGPKAPDATPDKEAERRLVESASGQKGQGLSVGFGSPALDAPGGLASAAAAPAHVLELSGYAILGASFTQQDANNLYIGRNNGFTLADARIEVTARPAESLWLFLSIDGAVANVSQSDVAQGTRVVSLKDAYGIWSPGGHLRVQGGQFKAPQSVEELLEETDIKFASRSILSAGVAPPYAYKADPLSLGRQLGLGIGTDRIELGPGGFTAQLAVTNGNGDNQLYNDAPYPSLAARAAYDANGISVGVHGSFQPRVNGDQLPRVYRDNVFTLGADVLVNRGPLHAMLLATWRTTRHVTQQTPPDEVALGLSGEISYRFGFVEPAVRLSYLDPTDQLSTDALFYTTAGLNFYVPGAPGRLSIDFTHRTEQSGRELSNDGIEASAQVRF